MYKSSESDDNSKVKKSKKVKKDKMKSESIVNDSKSKKKSRKYKESPICRSVDEDVQLIGQNTNRMGFYPQPNGPFRYPDNVNKMGGVYNGIDMY